MADMNIWSWCVPHANGSVVRINRLINTLLSRCVDFERGESNKVAVLVRMPMHQSFTYRKSLLYVLKIGDQDSACIKELKR